jgi:ATP-dependent DNA helicase RecG
LSGYLIAGSITLFPLAGGVSGGVNALLAFLADNPGKKTGEIRHALDNIPQRTLERWLKLLKAQGRIEFRGAPRTGGYFIRREG